MSWEYSILLFIISLFKNFVPIIIAKITLSSFYLLLFFYYNIHDSIYILYKNFPTWLDYISILKQGYNIAKGGYYKKLIWGSICIIVIVFILITFNNLIISTIYNIQTIWLGNLLFYINCFFVLLYYLRYKPNFFSAVYEYGFLLNFHFQVQQFFQSLFILYKNSIRSFSLIKLEKKFKINKETYLNLSFKPNIFLIGIESYGSILNQNCTINQLYYKQLFNVENSLKNNNWYYLSNLSLSPISGGKSWISYSNIIHGVSFENTWVFNKVFENLNKFNFNSFFNILNEHNYTSYLASAISGFEDYQIDWNKIKDFYGFNKLIQFKDLNYTNNVLIKNFQFSPPEQYFLRKTAELIHNDCQNQPFAVFFMTQNSHYPFNSPKQILNNWQDCNFANQKELKYIYSKKNINLIQKYGEAIIYQLQCLENLILNSDSNTIFIIFGDHQPPFITQPDIDTYTPIHIICKHKSLINNLKQFQFIPSLFTNKISKDSYIKHENLKSIFMNSFFNAFK